MKRIGPRALFLGLLALVGAALTFHLVGASGVTARSGRLAVTRGDVEPRVAEVRGDVLSLPGAPGRRLAAAASAPLVGAGAPVGTLSPDGRSLAYNSFGWRRRLDRVRSYAEQGIRTGDALGSPRVRIRDLATGEDTPFEPGSQSLAWREDGALAYAVGAVPDYRANLPFLARVVVRPARGSAPTPWTETPERSTVLAWAGKTLLLARGEPGATPDLVALDGPGRARDLALAVTFLGTSPDGAHALVVRGPADTPAPRLELVRVADGHVDSTLFLADARDPVSGEPTSWVAPPAAWSGDRVALASSTGLVVLRVSGAISVEQVLHLDAAARPNGALLEPRFADADARTIVAWSAIPGTEPIRAAQLLCDRLALTCVRGPALAPAAVPRPVYDLSGGTR
jgi:hypothetical protein